MSFRSIKSAWCDLRYLCASAAPELVRRQRRGRADIKYLQRRERMLRRMLCRCPWWIEGHLALGLLQIDRIELAGRSSRGTDPEKLPLLETLLLCAEAAEILLAAGSASGSPAGTAVDTAAGSAPPAELLESRFLRGMERYYCGDLAAADAAFSVLLKPRFCTQLRRSVWLLLHEYAGYTTLTLRGAAAASIIFNAIPPAARSGEIEKLLTIAA